MRRVILHEFGPYTNLRLEECADPVPAPDQVVVAIEAGGIGYVDTLCVHGTYQALPALPWVPGCELAGTVAAIGAEVTRFAVGDRVLGTSFAASFQTYSDAALDLKVAIRERTGGGADVAVDPIGGPRATQALRGLRFEGRHVVVGFASGEIPQVPLNQVLLNDRTVIGIDWDLWGRSRPAKRAALLDELFVLATDGRIRPAEPTAYPLEDAATALDDLEQRRVAGKVVLAPQA